MAILFPAGAGFCMVIGGMLLIWKGAIVLAGTDSSTALSIEWEKKFKLNTQAPGIAFFILGLLFSSLAIYSSRSTEPIYVVGTLDDVNEIVTVTVAPQQLWEIKSGSNGVIDGMFRPDTETINLKFTAACYEDAQIPHNLSKIKDRIIKIDNIKLKRKCSNSIETRPENIVSTTAPLPPIGSQPAFGAVQ